MDISSMCPDSPVNITVDKQSPIPIYHQISTNLRNRMMEREWQVGDKLPSEGELSDIYQVTRVTVRKALDELEDAGFIRRVRGMGSYVKDFPKPFIHDFSLPSALCSKLGQQGISVDSEMLVLEIVPPRANINTILALAPEQSLVFIKRRFLRGGQPIGINSSWISSALLPDIVERGLIYNHLSITLTERYNLVPVRITNTIESTMSTAADISLLGLTYDMPMFLLSTISYLENDTPLEYSKTIWLGDYVKFSLDMGSPALK